MPSTYTLNNGIELIGTGEQSGTWGDTTNTNLGLLDAALDGQVTITLAAAGSSGSPNALPITDGTTSNGRNRMVVFADGGDLGATAYVQLTPNDAEKIIYIRNSLSGSRSVILFQGTYNASNDYEVPAGTTAVVYFDGAGAGAVAANVFNNAYFDGLRLGSVSVTAILDEDNMASDSATALATQQSIKAYVDSQVGTVDTLAEILAIGNTTGATDIAVDSAQKVQFRDAAIYINSSVDGQLDIVADTEIQIAATTIDVNGALDVSGTALVTGVLTTTAATVFNGGFASNADSTLGTDKKVQFRDAAIYINSSVDGQLDIVADTEIQIAATTVDLNGALDVSGTLGVTGVLTATSLDISGDIDVDGTTNLMYVDVDGAVNFAADVTFADGADLITASAGTSNLRLGVNAGNSIIAGGNYNVVVGDEAGTAITTGIGRYAGGDITTAAGNVAIGAYDGTKQPALRVNTTGAANVAVGSGSLGANTTASNNTAVGYASLGANTTGEQNVAIGANALSADTLGSRNVALGFNTLAVQNFTTATNAYNIAIGHNAGVSVTTGVENVLIGGLAGQSLTDADYNVAIGVTALFTDTLGSKNTAIGQETLRTQNFTTATDSFNTAVGFQAGRNVTTGTNNTLIGGLAGDALTDGDNNVAVGTSALSAETRADRNVAIGS
jgi:hypothetical protein